MSDDATPPPLPVRRKCATMQVYHDLVEQYPDMRPVLSTLEHATQRRNLIAPTLRMAQAMTIPVVVHVVYRTPQEMITAAQVLSQITALNRDYSAANPDRANVPTCWAKLASGTGISFALTTLDPGGNPTSGITYTQTTAASFVPNDPAVKTTAEGGCDPWPADTYLNIWVCNLAGGILGYGTFPGTPAALDGVVIQHTAFGTTGTAASPFNLGRTAVHEIGHWLNLTHIWGDTADCTGSDFVDDTPPAQAPNYNVPTFPAISCNNGPNGDMFVNYMDYVDDAVMVMFTPGQVSRMHATLEGPRNSIVAGAAALVS